MLQKSQKKRNEWDEWDYNISKEFLAKLLVSREQWAFKNKVNSVLSSVVLWIHIIDATCKPFLRCIIRNNTAPHKL